MCHIVKLMFADMKLSPLRACLLDNLASVKRRSVEVRLQESFRSFVVRLGFVRGAVRFGLVQPHSSSTSGTVLFDY